MANVWVGDNYYITEIHEKNHTDTTETPNVTKLGSIVVKLQRLPESTYPNSTDLTIYVAGGLNPVDDKFPPNLAKTDYLANLLPMINTALSTADAAFDGSDAVTTDVSSFTQKSFD